MHGARKAESLLCGLLGNRFKTIFRIWVARFLKKSEVEFMDEISFIEITEKGNKDTKMQLKTKMNSV